jgi:hypothetical protein
MMRYRLLAAAMTVGFLSGGAAQAQNNLVAANGMSAVEVANLMIGEGLEAEISPGKDGGSIQSELSGASFDVFGVNCTAGRCTEFLFITGFDLESGFPLARVNEWNATKIAGRAYLDEEGDPFLDHIVSVSGPADGGAFKEGLYLWATALDAYIEFIELPSAEV